MPSLCCEDYCSVERRARAVRKKLLALGLDPRSNKWSKLWFREMRR
jgi:hypothetical protein